MFPVHNTDEEIEASSLRQVAFGKSTFQFIPILLALWPRLVRALGVKYMTGHAGCGHAYCNMPKPELAGEDTTVLFGAKGRCRGEGEALRFPRVRCTRNRRQHTPQGQRPSLLLPRSFSSEWRRLVYPSRVAGRCSGSWNGCSWHACRCRHCQPHRASEHIPSQRCRTDPCTMLLRDWRKRQRRC